MLSVFGLIYLWLKAMLPLPDFLFGLIFGSCCLWVIFSAHVRSRRASERLALFFGSICLASTAFLAFWLPLHRNDEIVRNFPLLPPSWRAALSPAIFWTGGIIFSRAALLCLLYSIKKWKYPPILPLLLILFLTRSVKELWRKKVTFKILIWQR